MDSLSTSGVGALCALGSAFTWSVISLLVRSLAADFNSITINALRSTLGGAVLLAWMLLTGTLGDLAAMSAWAFTLLSVSIVVAFGIGDTAFFESTRGLGLARAMTVSMTYPLIGAVLAVPILGEALTVPVVTGSLLTLGGLALVVTAKHEDSANRERFWSGVAAATLASLAWAVSVIVLKPSLSEVDSVTAQAIRLPLAAALLWATPWAWGVGKPLRRTGAGARWQIAGLGLLTAVSSVMFVAGVKHAGVAVATVLSSTAPVFAIPLGLFFLGERLAPAAIVGTIVTVVGVAVLQL